MAVIKSFIKHILLLGLLMGAVVGIFSWTFLFLINISSNFLWHELPIILKVDSYRITIVLCILGGIIIGVCQKFLGPYPKEMEEIIHEYKETKTINYEHLPQYIVCAFLPLVFGGSIGPEAGLFGMVAMLSTFLNIKIKNSNPELEKEVIESSTSAVLTAVFQVPLFSSISLEKLKTNKLEVLLQKLIYYVTYSCTVLTAFILIKYLNNLIHKESFIFKLPQSVITGKDLVYFIPIMFLSVVVGLSYKLISVLVEDFCMKSKLNLRPFTSSVIGGILLAILGSNFPLILFSGEHGVKEINNNYHELGVVYLLLIFFLKILVTRISISFRWVGGQIFPIIFSSFCLAFALSIKLNIDPTFIIAIMATGIITVILRKPILAFVLIGFFLPYFYWTFAIASALIINFALNKFHNKIAKTI